MVSHAFSPISGGITTKKCSSNEYECHYQLKFIEYPATYHQETEGIQFKGRAKIYIRNKNQIGLPSILVRKGE